MTLTPVPDPPADDFGPEPVHDLGAEKVTLGAMMLNAETRDEIAAFLHPEDHYRPAHGLVHAAILRLRDAKEPTDPVAVCGELQRAGELRGSLDGPYLLSLVEMVPVHAQGAHYARTVLEHSHTRRAEEKLTSALHMVRSPGFRPSQDMDQVRQLADEATGGITAGSGTAEWLSTAAWNLLSQLDKPLPKDRITPPYADLRKVIPALRPGQLITIAARPSIGKTLVAGDFVRHAALRLGLPVAWFTLEMTQEELVTRIFAAEALVDQECIQEHILTDAEWDRLDRAARLFGDSQVLIDEKSAATLAHIRAGLRRMSRTVTPRLAVVDYIQLAESPGAASRQEEISRLARGLKEIAKENAMPVIMAAQLNRNPESRQDKKPLQADLRESGEIENSSDIVILLHREDYYERDSARAGEMDLIVTKNRNGRAGVTVTVGFQGPYQRCVDLTKEPLPGASWSAHSVLEGKA